MQTYPPPYGQQSYGMQGPPPPQQGYGMQGPPPPQQGFAMQGPPPPQMVHGHVTVITQPGAGRTAAPGACRHCGIGYPHTSYPTLAIIIAILFFPVGVLCCIMMTERRCSHCNAQL